MRKNINVHVDESEVFNVEVNQFNTIVVKIGQCVDDVSVFMKRDTAKDLVLKLKKILLEGEDNDTIL